MLLCLEKDIVDSIRVDIIAFLSKDSSVYSRMLLVGGWLYSVHTLTSTG